MALDVLLIAPRSTYVYEIAQKVYPPLNLLYLAASLRQREYTVDVLDANALRLSDDEIRYVIRREAPSLVGIPVYSEILRQVRTLTELAKHGADCKVVLGGPHAAAAAQRTLEYMPQADFILCGEAEETLPMLAERYRDPARWKEVPGLWWRTGAGGGAAFSNTPCSEKRPDVNAIPLPARDLVDEAYRRKRYYTVMVRSRPVDTVMTSRGCPFRCNFCYNTNRRYRGRDPHAVMDELVRIRKRGIRNIEIVDDHFTADRQRAMQVFDLIIREKLGVSFRIKSRVNVVDEELLAKARQAGAYQVSYGTESGSQYILDGMNKRTKVADNARAIEMTKRAGLDCHTSWVFGYPGETPETIAETVDFIIRTKPTTANVALLRPYPETPVYVEAQDAGTLVGEWHPDAETLPWVRMPWGQTLEELQGVIKKIVRKIYYRPHYVFAFGSEVLRNANITLARYAMQELRRTLFARTYALGSASGHESGHDDA
jgi:anaerobic magnesium-protoporphyrin IX monomethyl ester cyclase